MPLDPNDPRRFYPDFQADTRQPQWVPMGDDQDQGIDVGPMAGAFKNRFMNQPQETSHAGNLPHGGMGGPTLAPHEEMPTEAPLHGTTTGAGKPGGFKSL